MKKAKKPLTKKAMKKTQGGSGADYILNKVEGVVGETNESSAQRSRVTAVTVTFSGSVG